MAANVENAAIFVDAFHALSHLFLEHVQHPICRHRLVSGGYDIADFKRRVVDGIAYFFENPRATEGGTSHHHGVDSPFFKSLSRRFARINVAVADNGDVHARILLHRAD